MYSGKSGIHRFGYIISQRYAETVAADLSNQVTNLQGFRCVLRYPVFSQGAPWQFVTGMTLVSQCLSGSRPDHP